jgi:hypothetical protein
LDDLNRVPFERARLKFPLASRAERDVAGLTLAGEHTLEAHFSIDPDDYFHYNRSLSLALQ